MQNFLAANVEPWSNLRALCPSVPAILATQTGWQRVIRHPD
jgi:hypothetical protein